MEDPLFRINYHYGMPALQLCIDRECNAQDQELYERCRTYVFTSTSILYSAPSPALRVQGFVSRKKGARSMGEEKKEGGGEKKKKLIYVKFI